MIYIPAIIMALPFATSHMQCLLRLIYEQFNTNVQCRDAQIPYLTTLLTLRHNSSIMDSLHADYLPVDFLLAALERSAVDSGFQVAEGSLDGKNCPQEQKDCPADLHSPLSITGAPRLGEMLVVSFPSKVKEAGSASHQDQD
jgi:hypothetical protein